MSYYKRYGGTGKKKTGFFGISRIKKHTSKKRRKLIASVKKKKYSASKPWYKICQ